MKAFLITIAVLQLISAGATLTKKPGAPRGNNPGAGVLLVVFILESFIAGWALQLLLSEVAA